jgi:hypothetical protein
LRRLDRKTAGELLRAAPEAQVRSLFAGLIYACSVDAAMKPALSAVVRVLDEERLVAFVRNLGAAATVYPRDEPRMGKRLLVLLKHLPYEPELFSSRLAALRAGARWLPQSDDRVRAWRQFQESWEQFVAKCQEKPGVFAASRLSEEREAAAQEMVAALAQAMPRTWYTDDRQASLKCRLVAALASQAAIAAEDLPADLERKAAYFFRSGKWSLPPVPASKRLAVAQGPQPAGAAGAPQGAETPVGWWWVLPALVGLAAVVTLAVAMTREIFPDLEKKLFGPRSPPGAATAPSPVKASAPANTEAPPASKAIGDQVDGVQADEEAFADDWEFEPSPPSEETGAMSDGKPPVRPKPQPTLNTNPPQEASPQPPPRLPLAEEPRTEITAPARGSSVGQICQIDLAQYGVRLHADPLDEDYLLTSDEAEEFGFVTVRQEWKPDERADIQTLEVWASTETGEDRVLARFQVDAQTRWLTFRLESCPDHPVLQRAQGRLRFCVLELKPTERGRPSRYVALQKSRGRTFSLTYNKAGLTAVATVAPQNQVAPLGAPLYLGSVRLRAGGGSQGKTYELGQEAAALEPTEAWDLRSFYDDFGLTECAPWGLESLRLCVKLDTTGAYVLAVETVPEFTATASGEVALLTRQLEAVRRLREQLRDRDQLLKDLNRRSATYRSRWLRESAANLGIELPDTFSTARVGAAEWMLGNVLRDDVAARRETQLAAALQAASQVSHPPELEVPLAAALRQIAAVEAEIYRIADLADGQDEQVRVRVISRSR